ncbi:MAG: LLM class F420-dependent oxidoreductase [Acidimicrobiales bacterium]
MDLSMPLSYAGGLKEQALLAADLEKAGLDLVWVAEVYGFDAVSTMGYLAAITERVRIGAGILPLYSRTPALIAQTAAGIDAVSEGRGVLGLGASGPQVIEGWHGVPYDRPLARTREIIDICRMIWRRERLTYDGRCYTLPLPPAEGTGLGKPLKLITHPVRERIPIWVAAIGEKNVQLAAELAEGWLPFFFVPEKANELWGEAIAAGVAKRTADLGPLQICAGGITAIGEESEVGAIRDFARPMIALYAGGMGAKGKNFYNELVRRYGFEREAEEIQELYLAGRRDEAAKAVPAELVEATTLCGPEGYIKDKLAAFEEAGVTMLQVVPVAPSPATVIERLKDWTS